MARSEVCKKVFIFAAGSPKAEGTHFAPGVERLEFRFANGNTESVKLSDYPDNIRDAFAWYGVSQKLGDGYADAKGSIDDAIESFLSLNERLVKGTWIAAKEATGPRVGLLARAIARAQEKAGMTPDVDAIIAKLEGDPKLRENALSNPAINAAYEELRLEAQQERAEKARAAAAASGGTAPSVDLGSF